MKQFLMKTLGGMALAATLVSTAQAGIIEVSSNITTDTRWTRDNVYVLTNILYVLPPAKLTIEPGTVIRGANDTQTGGSFNPGTLTISRGAKCIASGTVDDPIIFTSVSDTLVPGGANTRPVKVLAGADITHLNYDPNGPTSNNAFAHTKQTGGLVICGRTPIGYDADLDGNALTWNGTAHSVDTPVEPTAVNAGTNGLTAAQGNGVNYAVPEGYSITAVSLPVGVTFDPDGAGPLPASNTMIAGGYGGVDENDNSGVYRFWSVRYGGFNVSSNNEINGVTMCGVGRGTTMEWMEVSQNVDDNFEWFGGYMNAKYLFGLFGGDDGIDGDQGFSGKLQHIFVINDNENYVTVGRPNYTTTTSIGRDAGLTLSDKLVEWDGSESTLIGVTPQTNANVFNFSMIGNRSAIGAVATDDGFNCRLTDASQFSRGMIEDVHDTLWSPGDGTHATFPTTADLRDSLYFNVGSAGATSGTAENLATLAAATQFRGKLHTTRLGLDPRLVVNTAATTDARDLSFATIPGGSSETFFTPTLWHGAMRDNNMLFGWSWAHQTQIISDTNLNRPVLSLTISGGNPVVSFAAEAAGGTAGDAIVYVLERSTNGAQWTSVGFVQDDNSTTSTTIKRLGDSNATANQITVTDTDYAFTGSPVHYRVIAQ